MSVPIQLSILPPLAADDLLSTDFGATEDQRVLSTADDRPNTATLPCLIDPASDHGDSRVAERRDDVNEKHERVIQFLDETGLEAIILGRADSIAWFTSGADLGQTLGGDSAAAWLFINRGCRAVIADNVQSARIFEEEVAGLGFQLKERPWHEEPENVLRELAHGKRVVADDGRSGEQERLRALRLRLTKLERQRYRELGRTLTLAIEATAQLPTGRNRGRYRRPLGPPLAPRRSRAGRSPRRRRRPARSLPPTSVQIGRNPLPRRHRRHRTSPRPLHLRHSNRLLRSRRIGVSTSSTRLPPWSMPPISSSPDPAKRPPPSFGAHKRIYEKYRAPHEWMLDYQGFVTGYSPCEVALRPDGALRIEADSALRWSPSVGPTRSEDTVVVNARLRSRHRGPALAQARCRRQGICDPASRHSGTLNEWNRQPHFEFGRFDARIGRAANRSVLNFP